MPAGTGVNGIFFSIAGTNPFRVATEVEFRTAFGSNIEIFVYDVRGRKIRTLLSEYRDPGFEIVSWDGRGDNGARAAAGVYLIQFKAGDESASRRTVYFK